MMRTLPIGLLVLATLAGCASSAPRASRTPTTAPLAGVWDNYAQVWNARETNAGIPPPHVVVSIEDTRAKEWTLWTIRYDATPALTTTWAMRRGEVSGALAWIPHRPAVADFAAGDAFDPTQWIALDACALRESGRGDSRADAAACALVAPGIGAQAGLLPLSIAREGEQLSVRLYVDQARGEDAHETLQHVRTFAGWVALNGGGPLASAASEDWHTDQGVRIGTEGGRYPLHFRDGQPAGYALVLERVAYRNGSLPVLKLSVVDVGTARTLAYAWANPEATRIGLNLGWLQVGLDVAAADAPAR